MATQSDACVRNTVGMNPSSVAGGNVYVGPSLTSSLIRVVAALAKAERR
jgi:hypothetical protein